MLVFVRLLSACLTVDRDHFFESISVMTNVFIFRKILEFCSVILFVERKVWLGVIHVRKDSVDSFDKNRTCMLSHTNTTCFVIVFINITGCYVYFAVY